MVKKISVVEIKNEADDEALHISDDSQSEEEKVNVVEFNPTTVVKTKKENNDTTKQKTVEQHQCSDCLKYMSLKTLRYSHVKYCTARFDKETPKLKDASANTKLKSRIAKAQDEYENLRQTQPNPPIHKYEPRQIQASTRNEEPIRMKTAKEKKQEKYNEMMEGAF
jgi:hypothetical protein